MPNWSLKKKKRKLKVDEYSIKVNSMDSTISKIHVVRTWISYLCINQDKDMIINFHTKKIHIEDWGLLPT